MSTLSLLLAMSLVAVDSGEESGLTAARLRPTDKSLLDFFRKRSQPAPHRDVLKRLAQTLADPDEAKADHAQGELVCLGACVTPVLREVANRHDEQPRAAKRAKQIL